MARPYPTLLLLGLTATVVAAQQPAARPTPPLVTTLLAYVEDETFGKELKLTAEQVKKFVEHRKKQWDEQYTTAPAEYAKGAADRAAATATLFKEVLTADQHKRAEQLAAQNAWGNARGFAARGGFAADAPPTDLSRASVSAFRRYPALADALNLTAEQKKLLGGDAVVGPPGLGVQFVFLTPEQSKAAKALLGEPVKTAWNPAFDPRGDSFLGGRFGGSAPGLIGLTEAKDVRTEIGMTDGQVKALAPVLEKWAANTRAANRDLSPEAAAKAVKELQAETDKALAATLKPEQLTRLRQIERQTSTGFGGRGGFGATSATVPLTSQLQSPATRKALAFTPEQEKALAAADKANGDAITIAVAADGPVDDAIKAVTAAHDAHEKAYAAVLTAEQTKKLAEMTGQPFDGNTIPDRLNSGGGFGGQDSDQFKTMRAAGFGQRPPIELTLLNGNKSIQDELALKPEQVKKAAEKYQDYTAKYGPGGTNRPARRTDPEGLAKQRADVSAFVEKAVTEVLTADQVKRYRELMLQRAEWLASGRQRGASTAVPGAINYPGVAEAVKLTAEQKKKLLDGGESPNDVLTADQKTAIQGMLGKKYEGDWTTRPTLGGFGGAFANTPLPTTSTVLVNVSWDVFKLTPEQVAKLVPVANEYQLATSRVMVPIEGEGERSGFRSQPVDPAKQAAADEKLAKAIAATLTPEQAKRVEQVRYQLAAASGPPNRGMPLTNAAVAKALGLTDEQRAKVAAAVTDMQRLQSAAIGPSGFVSFGPGAPDWQTKLAEKTTARATAVLTAGQKKMWKELTGDPVPNLPTLRFGGPGGFGGF